MPFPNHPTQWRCLYWTGMGSRRLCKPNPVRPRGDSNRESLTVFLTVISLPVQSFGLLAMDLHENGPVLALCWAGLWLVKKSLRCGCNSSHWKNCLHFSILGNFQKIQEKEGKSSAHTVGVFSMLPNHPKCDIQQKSMRSDNFGIRSKIP